MRFVERRPSPALAPFVRAIWYFAGVLPHQRERVLPGGAMQILVNLDQDQLCSYHGEGYRTVDRIAGAGLGGAYARHFAIDTAEQRRIVGISFRPGGAYPFFAAPASATRELHVGLDDLWGRDGAVLRERLLEASTEDRILATFEAALLARVVRPLEVDAVTAQAIEAFDRGATVSTVMARVGMTPNRFIRHFSTRVGLTPKRFARVRRFQRVLATIDVGGAVDWARVAADCGYFDQSHLIRDFRAFAGVCPTAYQPRSDDARSHVPLV